MATILVRKKADGMTRYTAVVRLRKGRAIVHQEARTFTHRLAATSWARHREVALEDPKELLRVQERKQEQHDVVDSFKLGKLIRWYIKTFHTLSKWQRSKQSHLEFLERHPIAQQDVRKLTTAILVQHIQDRRAGGAGPSTAGNDLIWIGVVLRAAKSARNMAIDPAIVQDARNACRELRLIGRSRRRERRPSADEMAKLDEYFQRRDRRAKIPMCDIWHFANESAKREAEICRLEWADNDEAARTGLVRDAKHPRHKEGNHKRFKYTPEAWDIIQRQPKTSPFIFPYNPKSIGAAFTRACRVLDIEDLHFHDARHEGTSRLFERGYQIHEVAQFTLHDSWNELKRYTNLRPEKVREIPLAKNVADQLQCGRQHARNTATAQDVPSHVADRSVRLSPRRLPARATSDRRA
jgi:integrase